MYEAVRIAEQATLANEYPGFELKGRAYYEARDNYRARQREIDRLFAVDLAQELADDLPKTVQDRIFQLAWDEGHASGYSEVANHYEELAEFACAVRKAQKED